MKCKTCGSKMIESNEAEMYGADPSYGKGMSWNYCEKCSNQCVFKDGEWIWEYDDLSINK